LNFVWAASLLILLEKDRDRSWPVISSYPLRRRFGFCMCFVATEIGSRGILHCNVMVHPTADWATQQFREVLDDLYQIQAGPRWSGSRLSPGKGGRLAPDRILADYRSRRTPVRRRSGFRSSDLPRVFASALTVRHQAT
jgi:hypothetical protein